MREKEEVVVEVRNDKKNTTTKVEVMTERREGE